MANRDYAQLNGAWYQMVCNSTDNSSMPELIMHECMDLRDFVSGTMLTVPLALSLRNIEPMLAWFNVSFYVSFI